jgi:hypothetical protein
MAGRDGRKRWQEEMGGRDGRKRWEVEMGMGGG